MNKAFYKMMINSSYGYMSGNSYYFNEKKVKRVAISNYHNKSFSVKRGSIYDVSDSIKNETRYVYLDDKPIGQFPNSIFITIDEWRQNQLTKLGI